MQHYGGMPETEKSFLKNMQRRTGLIPEILKRGIIKKGKILKLKKFVLSFCPFFFISNLYI